MVEGIKNVLGAAAESTGMYFHVCLPTYIMNYSDNLGFLPFHLFQLLKYNIKLKLIQGTGMSTIPNHLPLRTLAII